MDVAKTAVTLKKQMDYVSYAVNTIFKLLNLQVIGPLKDFNFNANTEYRIKHFAQINKRNYKLATTKCEDWRNFRKKIE